MTQLFTFPGVRVPIAWLVGVTCAVAGCNYSPSQSSQEIPVSVSAPVRPPAEHDWPGWLGGSHGGVASGAALPVEWDSHSGVVWNVPVGPGSSSPIVLGTQVIITCEVPAGDASDCTLHSFDLASGEEIWSTWIATADGRSHPKNGVASATPASDGERIFTSLPPVGLFCHDLEGRLLWQHSLANVSHKWGFASSPVVYEGLVLQLCDSENESFLTAFAAATGKIVWQVARKSQGCWSTPLVTQVGGKDLLIVNGTGSSDGSQGDVIAYDPRTGAEIWRVTGTTDIPCPTAIASDGLIISASGGNGPVFALRAEAGLSATDRIVWRHAAGGPYVPTGIAYEGLLYMISDGGVLTCYRAADGEKLYRKRLHGTFSASLLAGDGKIYVTNETGDVYVIQAGEEYALLSTNRMRGRCLATPAIAHNRVVLRTESHLYCIGGQPAESESDDNLGPTKSLPSPSDTLLESEQEVPLDKVTATAIEAA